MSQSNGGVGTNSRFTLFPMQGMGVSGFYSFDPNSGFNDPSAQSNYSFRVEEVIPGRTPTIGRIIITYRDLGPVTMLLTLTGTNDSQQVVRKTVSVVLGNQNPTSLLMTKLVGISLGACQNQQLTITRLAGAGPLSISKIVMCGRVEQVQLA